jgi:hypothetical protein
MDEANFIDISKLMQRNKPRATIQSIRHGSATYIKTDQQAKHEKNTSRNIYNKGAGKMH